jgi:hypothetical protein
MIESVDVVSVATNGYEKYFVNLVTSADKYLTTKKNAIFHIFTDNPEKIMKNCVELKNVTICYHNIPSYQWPEATLIRYRLICENQAHFLSQVILYLDADMLFKSFVGPELYPENWKNGLAFVQHPGYWSKNWKLTFSPRYFFKFIKYGGIGTWETRESSSAFTERKFRRVYCCGGIWMGKRERLIDFARLMFESVEIDEKNGVIAVWHDESHLNKFVAYNNVTVLSPEYCYDSKYKNLNQLVAKVEAIRK